MNTVNGRKTQYPIAAIFLKRYSPRALSGESITKEELMTLFDAARWAPSSYNSQPWRFIYAMRDTKDFEIFLSLLGEGNQVWCKRAAVLVVVISKETMDYKNKPNPTHSLVTGSAWENLALQATEMGIITHGMAGFDYEKAKELLGVPDGYSVEMMIAIGKLGNVNNLPEDLRKGEEPSGRKELNEIVFEGKFSPNK
jgi:nitroreductase